MVLILRLCDGDWICIWMTKFKMEKDCTTCRAIAFKYGLKSCKPNRVTLVCSHQSDAELCKEWKEWERRELEREDQTRLKAGVVMSDCQKSRHSPPNLTSERWRISILFDHLKLVLKNQTGSLFLFLNFPALYFLWIPKRIWNKAKKITLCLNGCQAVVERGVQLNGS